MCCRLRVHRYLHCRTFCCVNGDRELGGTYHAKRILRLNWRCAFPSVNFSASTIPYSVCSTRRTCLVCEVKRAYNDREWSVAQHRYYFLFLHFTAPTTCIEPTTPNWFLGGLISGKRGSCSLSINTVEVGSGRGCRLGEGGAQDGLQLAPAMYGGVRGSSGGVDWRPVQRAEFVFRPAANGDCYGSSHLQHLRWCGRPGLLRNEGSTHVRVLVGRERFTCWQVVQI